ncbi:MAG: hypothetical protein ACREIS_12620 [Nitrospiraceae bacterium]
MPKLITAQRLSGEADKAREYVKVHILFPSGLLGLVFMVAGVSALIYQFVVDTYGWRTFVESTGLVLLGGLLGWAQTRYHRYLLEAHPGYFASRMRVFSRRSHKRVKKEAPSPSLEHSGRHLVPIGYLLGVALLMSASGVTWTAGHVEGVGAFVLPWAGFFWAKMFFWQGVVMPRK